MKDFTYNTHTPTRYCVIKGALDKHDPMNLLSLGCPADEYSSEARIIDKKIDEAENVNKCCLMKIITETFLKQFDAAPDRISCEKITDDILSQWG